MNEVWAKIAKTISAHLYSILMSLLALALTARLLGPEGRGQVAAIMAWVMLFGSMGNMSLGMVAINRATTRTGENWFGTLLGTLIYLALALSLLGWVVGLVLYLGVDEDVFPNLPIQPLIIGFAMLPLVIWESYKSSLLMAMERYELHNRSLVIGRTFSVLMLYLLVGLLTWGPTGAIIATAVGQAVISFGGSRAFISKGKGSIGFSWSEASVLAKGAVKLHINAIGAYLFSFSIGVLVINHYRSVEEVGYFQVAVQLFGIVMILPQAVSTVIFGKVTNLGPNKAWDFNKSILKNAMVLTVIVGAIAWFAAPWIILLVAGSAFAPSIDIFRSLLPVLLGNTLANAMAPQWIGRGLFIQASALTLTVGAVSLSISLLLTERLGVYGVVYAALVAYAVGGIINIGFYKYCNRSAAQSSERDKLHT